MPNGTYGGVRGQLNLPYSIEFLSNLSENKIAVLAITGNHDSRGRLSYLTDIIKKQKIYLQAELTDPITKVSLDDEYGKVDFYLQPFFHRSNISAKYPEVKTHYDALEILLKNTGVNYQNRSVLVAHQFFTSRKGEPQRSDSEQYTVGGIDNIDVSLVEKFNYVALGHLHKEQAVGREHIRYSGTLLKYSFGEAAHVKKLVVVNLGVDGEVDLEFLPYKPLRDLKIVRGYYEDILRLEGCDDFIKVELLDKELIASPVDRLKIKFPNFLGLEYKEMKIQGIRNHTSKDVNKMQPLGMIEEFYKFQYGFDIKSGGKEIVRNLLSSIGEGEDV